MIGALSRVCSPSLIPIIRLIGLTDFKGFQLRFHGSLITGRTDTVAESSFGMAAYGAFHAVPIVAVIAYFSAIRADGQNAL